MNQLKIQSPVKTSNTQASMNIQANLIGGANTLMSPTQAKPQYSNIPMQHNNQQHQQQQQQQQHQQNQLLFGGLVQSSTAATNLNNQFNAFQ